LNALKSSLSMYVCMYVCIKQISRVNVKNLLQHK
jgi:hypothetical protein